MKILLIRFSIIYIGLISCFFNNKPILISNKFIVQDSLISNFKSYKRIVYFGYKKNELDTLKWDDIIKIYHIKKNDTLLKSSFTFFRDKNEGNSFLSNKSILPHEKIEALDFVFRTSISNRGNYSENIFNYNQVKKQYIFKKRINFMEYKFRDTLGLKTTYIINKNVDKIDPREMNKIFKNEFEIYNGKRFKNCQWIKK